MKIGRGRVQLHSTPAYGSPSEYQAAQTFSSHPDYKVVKRGLADGKQRDAGRGTSKYLAPRA